MGRRHSVSCMYTAHTHHNDIHTHTSEPQQYTRASHVEKTRSICVGMYVYTVYKNIRTHIYTIVQIYAYTHLVISCVYETYSHHAEWQRPVGCLISVGHFPTKSPIISGSFAKNDLQLKTSYGSSPPCSMYL